jgi:hypothetical protein
MEGLILLMESSILEGTLTGIKVSRMIKIFHLLFVDDVLIMTKVTLKEWMEVVSILQLFCNALGLFINLSKNIVHYEGLTEEELTPLKELLPYSFIDLSIRFKYMGYYLKNGACKTEDWNWLVTKMEKKIGLWCNKWLSLGGHFVLVKVVLQRQPIYWMSLETIPHSILNKI